MNPYAIPTMTTLSAMKPKPYALGTTFSLRLVKERSVRYPASSAGTPQAARDVMRALLSDRDCEHLAVVMLDGRNEVIGAIVVATGGISNVVASVRDVFKGAIVGRASAILLGHNHPSGDVRPSPEDDLFTARVRAGADILGIPMLDHVIVSSGRGDAMFSYHAEGRL